eukprot:g1116.t1
MLPFMSHGFGNPSSSHALGKYARNAVATARTQVAALIDAPEASDVVFMSCGTESINYALAGALRAAKAEWGGGHLVTTQVEHVAVLETCRALEVEGFSVTYLPVDEHGAVSAEQVAAALRADTVLVSVMLANNETGALNPVREIARRVREREAVLGRAPGGHGRAAPVLLHTDASQALGKVPVSVRALGVDFLTVAGHKLYAPKGIGALYVRRSDIAAAGPLPARPPPPPLAKLLHGAGHEGGQRAGTENVLLNVGLGAACAIARQELPRAGARLSGLRDRLQQLLQARLGARMRLNGHSERRLPNTLNLSVFGVRAARVLARIEHRVAASAASACHAEEDDGGALASGAAAKNKKNKKETVYVSYVLQAMGLPVEWGAGTLRLTVGRFTTEAEVDEIARVVGEAVDAELREASDIVVKGGKGYQPPWMQ